MSSCKLGAIGFSAVLTLVACGARHSVAAPNEAGDTDDNATSSRRSGGTLTGPGDASSGPMPPPLCEPLAGPAGLVRAECQDNRLRFDAAMFKGPRTLALTEKARRVLDDVAKLMEQHPELLLLRIEVHWEGAAPKDGEARRKLMDRAQARADLLFQELWAKRSVWAERLDAVGYGVEGRSLRRFEQTMAEPRQRRSPDHPWRIVLRAVQWSSSAHHP